MINDLVLGLDFGTSSVKALFIGIGGEILKQVAVEITTTSTEDFFAEQRAEDYLEALSQISRNNVELISHVISIGLSGHTPSVVCVDRDGNSVRPVMTWQDNRARAEADDLFENYGNPFEIVGTSLPWSASACPA